MGSPHEQHDKTQESDHGKPPPPPEPEKDAGIIPSIKSPQLEGIDHLTPDNVDIFTLDAVAALKLLCRGTQLLVDLTGDIPPTPAIQSPPARFTANTLAVPPNPTKQSLSSQASSGGFFATNHDNIDGVPFTRTPIGSPEAHMHEPNSIPIVHGHTAQPAAIQYGVLVRKFYSKRPPPISLEDYLTRMHKYCPMSTAAYLATSHYITHLALKEKICPVTPRNVHRLLLAGLRVAMKALEDLSWPHERFAKVGGISEPELARLEVGFCFLMDFGLKVDSEMLTEEAKYLVGVSNGSAVTDNDVDEGVIRLRLPELRGRRKHGVELEDTLNGNGLLTPKTSAEKRKASSSLPMRPVQCVGQGFEIVGQS